ncbi:MAG: response regulator transcription factor [Clostridiaceae bacterium]
MIKLLLVDDEQPILDGLKVLVDWGRLGVEIAGTANNGQEALDKALELRPDLVITDVRMPVMGGLQLIRKLRECLPETKCIILSGYQEFEYAQEAMKYGAAGYLIKPVDEKDLENAIVNIKEAFNTANMEKEKVEELRRKFYESYPYMRNKLLYSIACGEIRNKQSIQMRLERFGINSFPEQYLCFIVEFEMLHPDNDLSDEDVELMRFAVANIINEIINGKTKGFVFYMLETQVITIVNACDIQAVDMDMLLNQVMHYISDFLKMPVTIGVSNVYSGFQNISLSFNEARSALKYKLLVGKGKIIPYKDLAGNMGNTFSIPLEIEKKLVNRIIFEDQKEILAVIEEFFNEFIKNTAITPEEIITSCKDILKQINRSFEEMGMDINKINSLIGRFDAEIVNMSINELKNYFTSLITEIKAEVKKFNSKGAITSISHIKEYISQNYSSQITLNTIAEKFYINASYVSRLFKKESTENFIDYLTNKRMEEAKKLLSMTDSRIYEISEKIGYNNPKYFSQLFEKIFGMTPTEYRNSNKK